MGGIYSDSDNFVGRHVKRGFLKKNLSLHHQNNRLENIYVFYLPLFNSVAKKL